MPASQRDVRKTLLKERKLRTNPQGEPDDDRLNEALKAFKAQYKRSAK